MIPPSESDSALKSPPVGMGDKDTREPNRDDELGDWREPALRGMFTVAAVVAPVSAVLGIVLRAPPRRVLDVVVIGGVGVAMPLLRLSSRVSLGTRAGATIGVLLGAGAFVLLRLGLAPGASLLLASRASFPPCTSAGPPGTSSSASGR
jgi:hypothetical protein